MAGYADLYPDGSISVLVVDNLDGTGTRTTYDADGNVTSVEQLTGLPVVVVPLYPTDAADVTHCCKRDARRTHKKNKTLRKLAILSQ